MKEIRRILSVFSVLLLLCCTLCACTGAAGAQSKENPFEMWKGPITLRGVLSVGEREYGLVLNTPDGKTGKVSFESPESMQGYVFEKADDGYFVSYGDLRVPLKAGTLPGGAGTLFSLLSADFTQVTKSEEKANGIDMLVYTLPLGADGEIRLFTKKADGTPLRIEFDSRMGSGIFHVSEVKYE